MRAKYSQLCAFVHALQRNWFGGSVTLEDAFLGSPLGTEVGTEEREREEEKGECAKRNAGGLLWVEPKRGNLGAWRGR
jgi:hypothetical protein